MKNKEILFAQWIAENHYRLTDVINGIYIWQNDDGFKSTADLLYMFELDSSTADPLYMFELYSKC
jgi:hypothetical protein